MRRISAAIAAFVCLLTLITGCGESEPIQSVPTEAPLSAAPSAMTRSNPKGDSWTILVYLCGTDLESQGSFASVNIEEMTKATQSKNVNVIIETGGTEKWSIDA
ncbi:MAG: hypothetical protein RR049_07170, partial [Angelakisella sp.]